MAESKTIGLACLCHSTSQAQHQRSLAKGRVVLAKGVFDLLHASHVQSLWSARSYGDILFVGLASDESVRRTKGSDRPVIPFLERAAMLQSMRMVDYIVEYDRTNLADLVLAVTPDVYVGSHAEHFSVSELQQVRDAGVAIELVAKPAGRSTSDIISLIREQGAN